MSRHTDTVLLPAVVLGTLLCRAADAPDCREAVRELGRFLKADDAWHAETKRVAAWRELAALIEENRTGAPWWDILRYADGEAVGKDVEAFFAGESPTSAG